MKNTNLILIILLGILLSSSEDFPDENPDNRTEINNKTKIRKLLVSAYPSSEYVIIGELSSDNIVDFKKSNPNSTKFLEELAYWKEIKQIDNSDPRSLWQDCYAAIANSNQALKSIEELGEENLKAEKGEALITRAYAHFILVNIFCKHFNKQTSTSDLGIPYIEKPENTLSPKYERGTVAQVYEKLEKDIEEALPLISDEIYNVGLYHFTKKAAYAFAARFNLYYENWQKAKDYATLVVSENPETKLRDWQKMGQLPSKQAAKANDYIDNPANLFAFSSTSSAGQIFGPFLSGSRFNNTMQLSMSETFFAPMPWSKSGVKDEDFNNKIYEGHSNNYEKLLFFKIPFLFEITDAVQQIGFPKTVIIPFTTDETLLIRAEAEALLGETEQALADLNVWSGNFYKEKTTTIDEINYLYDSLAYSTAEHMSCKKKLNPKFNLNSGTQENLIHYILQCRRVLTLHEGLRWFDIKRYGIEINRRLYQSNNKIITVETLAVDDNRRALQLPKDVILSGLEANPR